MGSTGLAKRLARGISLAGLIAAAGAAASPEARAQALRPISVGLPVAAMNSSYCMFPAATKLGYFAAEKLEVRFQAVPGSATVLQTLQSGQLDIGGSTPEPVYKSISDGADLVFIYDYVRKPTGSVAVAQDSPINGLADLRGKRLGAQSLASGNIMLTTSILSQIGIDAKTEVTYLSVGVGGQALQALRAHHVDGLILFDSQYAQMEAMGAKLRYYYGPGQERLFSTQFLMRRSMAQADPGLAEGFGRALAKATLFASANPEACVRMMWQAIPATRMVGQPEAEQLPIDVAVLNKRMELLMPPPQGWGWYDRHDIDAWNAFATQGHIIDTPIADPEVLYTNRFVAAYNAFDAAEVSRQAREWKP